MSFKEPKTKGLAGAKAMVDELAFLTGTNMGADFIADQARRPAYSSKDKGTTVKGKPPTHEEVLEYLRLGGRSLDPNETDAEQASTLLLDDIAKHLKLTGQTVTDRKGNVRVKTKEKQALAGATAGLMKACKNTAKNMSSRMKAQKTSDGSTAKPVSQNDGGQYARTRKSNYNVAESVVYIASGQLANAIASGKVKIYLEGANVGKLLDNIS